VFGDRREGMSEERGGFDRKAGFPSALSVMGIFMIHYESLDRSIGRIRTDRRTYLWSGSQLA
jgi:hypothetical protein